MPLLPPFPRPHHVQTQGAPLCVHMHAQAHTACPGLSRKVAVFVSSMSLKRAHRNSSASLNPGWGLVDAQADGWVQWVGVSPGCATRDARTEYEGCTCAVQGV